LNNGDDPERTPESNRGKPTVKIGYRLLLALYCAFVVHAVLTFAWGPDGTEATKRLLAYRDRLRDNSIQLSERNGILTEQLEALRSDSEPIALAARSLGYYRPGERVVRIEGLETGMISHRIGSILEKPRPYMPFSGFIRATACVLAALVGFLLTSFPGNSRGSR